MKRGERVRQLLFCGAHFQRPNDVFRQVRRDAEKSSYLGIDAQMWCEQNLLGLLKIISRRKAIFKGILISLLDVLSGRVWRNTK
jgi:hypothetical protein